MIPLSPKYFLWNDYDFNEFNFILCQLLENEKYFFALNIIIKNMKIIKNGKKIIIIHVHFLTKEMAKYKKCSQITNELGTVLISVALHLSTMWGDNKITELFFRWRIFSCKV